jgi:hypothetical protein
MGRADAGGAILSGASETGPDLARRLAGLMAVVAQRRAAAARPEEIDLAPLVPVLRDLLAEVAAARDGQRDLAPLLVALEDELERLHGRIGEACMRASTELAALSRHERAGRAYGRSVAAFSSC